MRVTLYALVIICTLVHVQTAHAGEIAVQREFTLLTDGIPAKPLKFGQPIIGTPAVVKYRFLNGASPPVSGWYGMSNCENLQPIRDTALLEILTQQFELAAKEWSKVAQISFQNVDDDAQADVLVGFQEKPLGIAWANLNVLRTRNQDTHTITRGIVCLNPYKRWVDKPTVDEENYAAFVFAHEIGHILGFDHAEGVSKDSLMFIKYPQARAQAALSLSESDIKGARYLYGKR